MIKNKNDLRKYLEEDCFVNLGKRKLFKFELFLKLLYRSESGMAYHYLRCLRKYEYAMNKCNSNWSKIYLIWRRLVWHRLSFKYNIIIQPNTVKYGLYLPHLIGGGIVINCESMGQYCTINTGVLIGNKNSNVNRATIGNNVILCPGSKVIGAVSVGNNTIIVELQTNLRQKVKLHY